MSNKVCTWKLYGKDSSNVWKTECGWVRAGDLLNDDGSQLTYCPYCKNLLLKEVEKGIFSVVPEKKER
jgi:hypothetical protein